MIVSILVFIFTASYYKSKAKVPAHNKEIETKQSPPWEKYTTTTKKVKNTDLEKGKEHDATTAILKTGIESLNNKKGFFETFKDVLNVTSSHIEKATRKEEKNIDEIGKQNSEDKKPKTKTQRIWKRQERCRDILEKVFNKKFPQSRPAWNINTEGCPELNIKPGRRLELDGYCEEEGIAFEHQGKFHEVEGEAFSSDPIKFKYIKTKDRIKRENCKKNNVILLSIPDEDVVPFDELYEYITEDLERRGIIEFED